MILFSFLTAVPTAELEPITENYVQSDEVGVNSDHIMYIPNIHVGRHGHDLRRIICVRTTPQSR